MRVTSKFSGPQSSSTAARPAFVLLVGLVSLLPMVASAFGNIDVCQDAPVECRLTQSGTLEMVVANPILGEQTIRVGVRQGAWTQTSSDSFSVTAGILDISIDDGTTLPVPVLNATASCNATHGAYIEMGSDMTEFPMVGDGLDMVSEWVSSIGIDADVSLPRLQVAFGRGDRLRSEGFRGPLNRCRYYAGVQVDTEAEVQYTAGNITLEVGAEPLSATMIVDPFDPAFYVAAQSSMAGDMGIPISKAGFGMSWNGTLVFESFLDMWKPTLGAAYESMSFTVNTFSNVKANLIPIPGFPVKLLMDAEVGMGLGGSLTDKALEVFEGLEHSRSGNVIDMQAIRGMLGAQFYDLRMGFNVNSLDVELGPVAITLGHATMAVKNGKLWVHGKLAEGMGGGQLLPNIDLVDSYCSRDASGLAGSLLQAMQMFGMEMTGDVSLYLDLMHGSVQTIDGAKVYVPGTGQHEWGIRASFKVRGADCSPTSGLGFIADVGLTNDGVHIYSVEGTASKPSCSLSNLRNYYDDVLAIVQDATCTHIAPACESGELGQRCGGVGLETCMETCEEELCADSATPNLCRVFGCGIMCLGQEGGASICDVGSELSCEITTSMCEGYEPLCVPATENEDGSHTLTGMPQAPSIPGGQPVVPAQPNESSEHTSPAPRPRPPACEVADDGTTTYRICNADATTARSFMGAAYQCNLFPNGRLLEVTSANLATALAMADGDTVWVRAEGSNGCTMLTPNGTLVPTEECRTQRQYLCEVPPRQVEGCPGERTMIYGDRHIVFCPERVQPEEAADTCRAALPYGMVARVTTSHMNQSVGQVTAGEAAWLGASAKGVWGQDEDWGDFRWTFWGTMEWDNFAPNQPAAFPAPPEAEDHGAQQGCTTGWSCTGGGSTFSFAMPTFDFLQPGVDVAVPLITWAFRSANGLWRSTEARVAYASTGWIQIPTEFDGPVTARGTLCESLTIANPVTYRYEGRDYRASSNVVTGHAAAMAACANQPGNWQLANFQGADEAAFMSSVLGAGQKFRVANGDVLTTSGLTYQPNATGHALCQAL